MLKSTLKIPGNFKYDFKYQRRLFTLTARGGKNQLLHGGCQSSKTNFEVAKMARQTFTWKIKSAPIDIFLTHPLACYTGSM